MDISYDKNFSGGFHIFGLYKRYLIGPDSIVACACYTVNL